LNTFIVANPNKCIGCKACEIACAVSHLDSSVATAGFVEAPFSPRVNLIRAEKVTAPIQCRQCDDAPCANVCPVSAIIHEENKIIVKTELCIGCKTCVLACPIGAMDMALQNITKEEVSKEVMVAHKCDLCVGRPEGPACVEVCPGAAFVVVEPKVINESIKNKRKANALKIMGK